MWSHLLVSSLVVAWLGRRPHAILLPVPVVTPHVILHHWPTHHHPRKPPPHLQENRYVPKMAALMITRSEMVREFVNFPWANRLGPWIPCGAGWNWPLILVVTVAHYVNSHAIILFFKTTRVFSYLSLPVIKINDLVSFLSICFNQLVTEFFSRWFSRIIFKLLDE